jgi:hypothetical protein
MLSHKNTKCTFVFSAPVKGGVGEPRTSHVDPSRTDRPTHGNPRRLIKINQT